MKKEFVIVRTRKAPNQKLIEYVYSLEDDLIKWTDNEHNAILFTKEDAILTAGKLWARFKVDGIVVLRKTRWRYSLPVLFSIIIFLSILLWYSLFF